MPALIAYTVGMKNKAARSIQYTVRNVPLLVDAALRRAAREEKKSLNRVLLEALEAKAGVADADRVHDDMDHLAGQWVDDPECEQAIAAQDEVDASLWERDSPPEST